MIMDMMANTITPMNMMSMGSAGDDHDDEANKKNGDMMQQGMKMVAENPEMLAAL